MPDTGTTSTGPGTGSVPAGYGYEWERFADWCTATDRPPLPAHPVTVAEFLDEHPAAPATQRRRLAAITQAHTAHGHPSPAAATAIRALLHPTDPDGDARREAEERREVVTAVIAGLPSSGWPHGLFGRRDSLLLVLTQLTNLTPTQVSRLRRGDLSTDRDGQLLVTTGSWDTTVLPAGDDPRSCPGCVHRRWAWIGQVTDRSPAVRTLRDALRCATTVTADSPHRCAAPTRRAGAATTTAPPPLDERSLLTPIDSWGYQPLYPTALSAKAISKLAAAHLDGTAAAHRTLPAPVPAREEVTAVTPEAPPTARPSPTEAAARHTAALQRRRHDQQQLTQASTALTGIDNRIQDLLERTLALLETAQDPATGSTRSR